MEERGTAVDASTYHYPDAGPSHSYAYLLPALAAHVDRLVPAPGPLMEIGCGNGYGAAYFVAKGYRVTAIDPSQEGIARAREAYPGVDAHEGSAYDNLASVYGRFPLVYSLEVVEHLYDPRRFAFVLHDLVEPGGHAVISAPYHGYLKNLTLAALGRMDRHFDALTDNGHIKFWSTSTLGALLERVGFRDIRFERLGRVPALAKSMMAVARRPI